MGWDLLKGGGEPQAPGIQRIPIWGRVRGQEPWWLGPEHWVPLFRRRRWDHGPRMGVLQDPTVATAGTLAHLSPDSV